MTRRYLLAVLCVSYGFAQTEALPAASTILDRYVEVTGGKAAYEKRKNEVALGTLRAEAQGMKGSIKRYSAEPAQEYSVMEIENAGKFEVGLSGGVAWESSSIMGARVKSGEEKNQAVREGTFNAPLHWREQYAKVETIGTEVLDGELCYKVLLTPATGKPETMYFQKKSGLAMKTLSVAVTQMGEVPSELIVLEYKQLGGILAPAKVMQKAGGLELILTFDDVKINQAIAPDRFAPPADVKAILNKAEKK
jgi:hypothetical protein